MNILYLGQIFNVFSLYVQCRKQKGKEETDVTKPWTARVYEEPSKGGKLHYLTGLRAHTHTLLLIWAWVC